MADALFLSGLLLGSLWDRRSGTRGLDSPDGLRSPGSLEWQNRYCTFVSLESSCTQPTSVIDVEFVEANMVPRTYLFGETQINYMACVYVNLHLITLLTLITLVPLRTPSFCSVQQLC